MADQGRAKSLTTQLAELHDLGIQHELYDAAEWLTQMIELSQKATYIRVDRG